MGGPFGFAIHDLRFAIRGVGLASEAPGTRRTDERRRTLKGAACGEVGGPFLDLRFTICDSAFWRMTTANRLWSFDACWPGDAERPLPALRWVAALACGGVCREPCLRIRVTGRSAGPCGLAISSRERPRTRACAVVPGQTAGSHHCALPGLSAPGASWPGCLAAPHNRYHPAIVPRLPGDGPAGGGGASGAVTPNRFALGASGPVSPSPPAVWFRPPRLQRREMYRWRSGLPSLL